MKFFFIFLFLLGGGLSNVLKAMPLQASSDIRHQITVVDKDGETIPYIHAIFSGSDRYVLSNEEGVLSFSEKNFPSEAILFLIRLFIRRKGLLWIL